MSVDEAKARLRELGAEPAAGTGRALGLLSAAVAGAILLIRLAPKRARGASMGGFLASLGASLVPVLTDEFVHTLFRRGPGPASGPAATQPGEASRPA